MGTAAGTRSLPLNAAVVWQMPFAKGARVAGSVHNIPDADFPCIEAYDGCESPAPGLSRERLLRLSWDY